MIEVPKWFPWRPRPNGKLGSGLRFLPDYRDKKAYPLPSAPPERWAWEFLRRNPFYRGAWADAVADSFSAERIAKLADEKLNRGSNGRFILPRSKDKALIEQTMTTFNRQFGLLTFPQSPATDNLSILVEPAAFLDIDEFENPRELSAFLSEFKTGDFYLALLPKGQDIKGQLSRIEKQYKQLPAKQRTRPRNSPHHWQVHLRLIDALYTGANKEEILDEFGLEENTHQTEYRPQKSLSAKIDRAMFMLARGYRFINMSPE